MNIIIILFLINNFQLEEQILFSSDSVELPETSKKSNFYCF
jgi:hypothetical protein